ncbi:MAG: hypothetical protein GY880_23385 [Planctomycetaceae bacterium]|nr:hypothetical protein [Planctomycetaceae bacterium]
MKGQVLDFSVQSNSGIISGTDGARYNFSGSEWKEAIAPSRGMHVDFESQGANAVSIYRALGGGGGAAGAQWGGGTMAALMAGSIAIPLIGIIFGIIGLMNEGKRGQGGTLLTIGVLMTLVYIVLLEM